MLLDTHYVLALAGSPGRLSDREIRFRHDQVRRFVVGAVSLWEIRLKWNAMYRSGRRKGPASPSDVIRLLSAQAVDFLPLTPVHAATELRSSIRHFDPFDELLLAQAQAEGLSLVSRDELLAGHPLVHTIDNSESIARPRE